MRGFAFLTYIFAFGEFNSIPLLFSFPIPSSSSFRHPNHSPLSHDLPPLFSPFRLNHLFDFLHSNHLPPHLPQCFYNPSSCLSRCSYNSPLYVLPNTAEGVGAGRRRKDIEVKDELLCVDIPKRKGE